MPKKRKGPIDHSPFYQPTKLTKNWSEALTLETFRTGGYPIPDDPKLDPSDEAFPIQTKEWRGIESPGLLASPFFLDASRPFSPAQLRKAAKHGENVIRDYGSLTISPHSVQESEMCAPIHLVSHARDHLASSIELCEDVCELRHIGAIPKFRGPSRGESHVRGLQRHPDEEEFAIGKPWKYVGTGKMVARTADGIPCGTQYFCPLSTTVARKLPDRTISGDRGLIRYGRLVNLRCRNPITGQSLRHQSAISPPGSVNSDTPFLYYPFSDPTGISILRLHDVGPIRTGLPFWP